MMEQDKREENKRMMFQAFLIKYGEIGIKGKNRYLFEDALIRQMKFSLQDVEGEFHIHKSQGRIYVDCEGYYDLSLIHISFFEQLNDPLIYVLLVAVIISLLLHEISDAMIILVVVTVNAVVGVIQEGKAQKALEALKGLTIPKAIVKREGRKREVLSLSLIHILRWAIKA